MMESLVFLNSLESPERRSPCWLNWELDALYSALLHCQTQLKPIWQIDNVNYFKDVELDVFQTNHIIDSLNSCSDFNLPGGLTPYSYYLGHPFLNELVK